MREALLAKAYRLPLVADDAARAVVPCRAARTWWQPQAAATAPPGVARARHWAGVIRVASVAASIANSLLLHQLGGSAGSGGSGSGGGGGGAPESPRPSAMLHKLADRCCCTRG